MIIDYRISVAVDEKLKVLASVAADAGIVLIGSQRVPSGERWKVRIRLHCPRHGPFLAAANRDRSRFLSWCTACTRESSAVNARTGTRDRLAAYVTMRGGVLLDGRLERGQSYARILCNKHGSQRLSIRGALSKRKLWRAL